MRWKRIRDIAAGLRESAARAWRRVTWRRFLLAVTGIMPLVTAAVPVVAPTSFEPVKQCTKMVFCSSVWLLPSGPNWQMGIFAAATVWLVVAAVIIAFASSSKKPLSAWARYGENVGISTVELLRYGSFDALSDKDYRALATRLLDTIAALARSLSGATEDAKVHASLMVAVAPDDPGVGGSVHFVQHQRELMTYKAVLIADAYSSGTSFKYIRLPVDGALPRVLPGAPMAYARGVLSIDDTLDIDWSEHPGIDELLRTEIRDYFRSHRATLRSLICIPLKRDPVVLGVLNIAAAAPRQFLESANHVSEIVAPYIALLLALVDHRLKKGYPYPS